MVGGWGQVEWVGARLCVRACVWMGCSSECVCVCVREWRLCVVCVFLRKCEGGDGVHVCVCVCVCVYEDWGCVGARVCVCGSESEKGCDCITEWV